MKKVNQFLLFFIIIAAFVLFNSTKGWAQNKYILYVTYKLPTNPDLISDASNLESECTNKHAVCMQACQIGDGKIDCQNRCEQAFRQCLLGINGVKFWLAACQEGSCEHVTDIIPLTREEALDIRLNDKFNEIKPGYYYMTGTYVTISSGSYTFRRTRDDAAINFAGSNFIGQAISNYNSDPKKDALYAAIENGQTSLKESLLSRGVDVNGYGNYKDFYKPIDIAQKMERWDIVKELVSEYNADVNQSGGIGLGGNGGTGLTVLQGAVKKKDMGLVKLFLDHGALINGTGSCGSCSSSLGIALSDNNIPMMELLISQGANVSGRYFTGESYFGQVAARGNLSLLKIFIQNGADINIENYTGETALDLAEKNNLKEVATFLRSKGAKNHK